MPSSSRDARFRHSVETSSPAQNSIPLLQITSPGGQRRQPSPAEKKPGYETSPPAEPGPGPTGSSTGQGRSPPRRPSPAAGVSQVTSQAPATKPRRSPAPKPRCRLPPDSTAPKQVETRRKPAICHHRPRRCRESGLPRFAPATSTEGGLHCRRSPSSLCNELNSEVDCRQARIRIGRACARAPVAGGFSKSRAETPRWRPLQPINCREGNQHRVWACS